MFVLAQLEVVSEIALHAIDPHAAITLQRTCSNTYFPALTENLEHRRAQFHLAAWGQLQHALRASAAANASLAVPHNAGIRVPSVA